MTLRMFTDGDNYVIADSVESAHFAWAESVGEEAVDYVHVWRAIGESRRISIDVDDYGSSRTQTVAEWIAECGPGVLASSDY